jgi:hypothetical protein
MYPKINSVSIFKPILVFVIAWMIPIGRENANEMPRASKKAHHARSL